MIAGVTAGSVTISVQADLRALAVPAPTAAKGRRAAETIKEVGGDLLAAAIAKDAADAAREAASGSTVPEDPDDDSDDGSYRAPGDAP